jgi:hypothetical protein
MMSKREMGFCWRHKNGVWLATTVLFFFHYIDQGIKKKNMEHMYRAL